MNEDGAEKAFQEIKAENSPNLVKDIILDIQEAPLILTAINPKKARPRQIIIKLLEIEDKEKILKSSQREMTLYL